MSKKTLVIAVTLATVALSAIFFLALNARADNCPSVKYIMCDYAGPYGPYLYASFCLDTDIPEGYKYMLIVDIYCIPLLAELTSCGGTCKYYKNDGTVELTCEEAYSWTVILVDDEDEYVDDILTGHELFLCPECQ